MRLDLSCMHCNKKTGIFSCEKIQLYVGCGKFVKIKLIFLFSTQCILEAYLYVDLSMIKRH
jgi:hypothetical protein